MGDVDVEVTSVPVRYWLDDTTVVYGYLTVTTDADNIHMVFAAAPMLDGDTPKYDLRAEGTSPTVPLSDLLAPPR